MYVVDFDDRVGFAVDVEYAAVQTVVEARKHFVEHRFFSFRHAVELLDARYAGQPHVLGNLHGIGAPRGYHLASRSDKAAFYRSGTQGFRIGKRPH